MIPIPILLLLPIAIPALLGALIFVTPYRWKTASGLISLAGTAVMLGLAWLWYAMSDIRLSLPWLQDIISFDLRLYGFARFLLLWIAIFGFLVTLYALVKMREHPRARDFYGFLLLTLAAASGSVLAENFVVFLFFWEGLLLTLYGLILLGGGQAQRTAVKSFIISVFCDFCLILGIAILWTITGSASMPSAPIAPTGLAAAAFILMMIGAIGKAGAMPFHTWIPDAALDAPLPVMAILPAALEKLLGIYLLARICLDFFSLQPNSPLSILLMTIGAITILLAVLMALIQKDFKKLLSFHAISQVGYMILGIGTALPIGIAGGIFHMVNHAIYKSGLFLSAGSVEHRAGTTELKKLGGLWKEMPVTAAGFAVCALAISGVWPLNGFVSKEMIFHGSIETGYIVFAIAAWLGAVFTFASFLKAGHAIFLGPRNADLPPVKESPSPITLPIVVLAFFCILFGVANALPLNTFIAPILEGRALAGEHLDLTSHALDLFNAVALISLGMLVLGLGVHLLGWFRAQKRAYLASELIHHLPGLHTLYGWSEARVFDLYEQGVRLLSAGSDVVFRFIDRPIDDFYEKTLVGSGQWIIRFLKKLHNGSYANYLAWCLAGLAVILIFLRGY